MENNTHQQTNLTQDEVIIKVIETFINENGRKPSMVEVLQILSQSELSN